MSWRGYIFLAFPKYEAVEWSGGLAVDISPKVVTRERELNEVRICRAEKKDLSDIINLSVEVVSCSMSPQRQNDLVKAEKIRRDDMAALYWQISKGNMAVFIAKNAENKIVGHVVAKLDMVDFLTGEKQAWVLDLAVKPEYWSCGLGQKLMEAVETAALGVGVKYVGLTVTCANRRAADFYKKMGYQDERVQMVKELG